MTIAQLFRALQNSAFSVYLSKQDHLFGAVAQLFHITGLILVLSPILLISLRLLGLGLVKQSVPELVQATARWIWAGLAILAVSGLVIFLPAASNYSANPVSLFKFILLSIAMLFHVTWYRNVTRLESPRPIIARPTAVLAITIWFGIAFAGRFIGFY
jgi:hypothetical protein